MKTRRINNRRLFFRGLGTLAAVALLVYLFEREGWTDVILAFKEISMSEFLAALGLLLISRIFVILRWHALLRYADVPISFTRTASLTLTGLFATNFLPTTIGGDMVRLAGAIKMGFDRAVCLASLVADRLIGMLGMAFALPFGVFPFLNSVDVSTAQSIALSPFIHRVWGFLRQTLRTFAIWAKKPEAVLVSLACTLGNMFFIFAALRELIAGLHQSVPFILIAGLWSLTYFITLVPISINGYGVQELSLSFLLAGVGGMGNAESLTVAVLIRALFIFASLPGALFLPVIMTAFQTEKIEQ